jgi:hypothetical protein
MNCFDQIPGIGPLLGLLKSAMSEKGGNNSEGFKRIRERALGFQGRAA